MVTGFVFSVNFPVMVNVKSQMPVLKLGKELANGVDFHLTSRPFIEMESLLLPMFAQVEMPRTTS